MTEKTSPPPDPTRRRVLAALAGAGGLAIAGVASADSKDPTRTPGRPPSALGERSPHARLERQAAFGALSGTPLQDLHGTITPSDLHFERHHAGIPAIDPTDHELLIHGMVERPLKFSMRELLRFPAVSRVAFLECSGNLRVDAGEETTPQFLCGLTSQSEWTGVALATLLREVGLKPGAKWLLAEGGDAAVMTRSIPLEKALDDSILAYAQNGEPLRPGQGFPIRLFNPGWEGNTSVKWLRRIEVSDQPFMTREETSKYTEPIGEGRVRQFSFTMDARSIITTPSYPDALERGWHELRGIAWSGRGRITRVEVSLDGGRRWQAAKFAGPVLPKAHTRFTFPFRFEGAPLELASRAIDETGYVQPTAKQLLEARGPGSGVYHLNPIVSWGVQGDGTVLYKPLAWG